MTEAQLQDAVIDLCRLYGLKVAHFRPARTDRGWRTPVGADGAGFPDLVIVGRNGVLWRELKSDRGYLSHEQQAWLCVLTAAGGDTAVWRPCHWPDHIEAELAALAGRRKATA